MLRFARKVLRHYDYVHTGFDHWVAMYVRPVSAGRGVGAQIGILIRIFHNMASQREPSYRQSFSVHSRAIIFFKNP